MNQLKITEIYIFPVKNEIPNSTLKAYARVVVNDQLTISGIRIVEGKNGLFISFPQEFRKEDNRYFNLVSVTTIESRQYFNDEILDEYLSLSNEKVNTKLHSA